MNVQKKLAFGFIRAKLNTLSIINKKKAGEEAFKLFCTPVLKSRKISSIFDKAEKLQFLLNGRSVKGFRCNHPKEHKVLLLHGFSSNCHNFDQFVTPLINKNYEVIAFDAPAHGASEGVTINAVEYSDMIKKVIDLYGPIKGFIAHSFGGLAVCLALESIPHDENTRIALIAPATETTTAIDIAFNIIGLKNPAIKKSMEDVIFQIGGKETAWYSIRRAMNQIKATVLWIHDEDDDITPLSDALKVRNDSHSNIQFMITSGLGHRKIYRDAYVKEEL